MDEHPWESIFDTNHSFLPALAGAFDLPNTELRDSLASKLMDNKVIVLGSGIRSIRFRPHLNITKQDIDKGIIAIKNCLKSL